MNVLLLDSDRTIAQTLEAGLGGARIHAAHEQGEGLRLAARGGWDLILLDAGFSGAGLEILSRLAGGGCETPVVLLVSDPSLDTTLAAIRYGAHDVLPKPLPVGRLCEIVRSLGSARRVRPLRDAGERANPIVGSSPEMLAVYTTLARSASSDATVLILGESGTGKELVARVLHAHSPRAGRPFVAINCAAIPENLLESELFGHEKGAFTGAIGRRVGRFEQAHGGTLFLDEVGDMSLALQAKILRSLQEREIERVGGAGVTPVDVRVLAATHRDLATAVREGRFREDLYYRLAVVTLHLPPLRSRGEDLDTLAEHFVSHYVREYRRSIVAIAEETLQTLRAQAWPGNVRQLRNVIERAVVMASGEVLLPQHLPADVFQPSPLPAGTEEDGAPLCTLEEMERRMIRRALREAGGNLTAAAERLGIHRNTLRRKMTEYQIR